MSGLDAGMLSVGVMGVVKPSWGLDGRLLWRPGSGGGGTGEPATMLGIGRETELLAGEGGGESWGFPTGSCDHCVMISGGGSAAAVETSLPDWARSEWRTLAY